MDGVETILIMWGSVIVPTCDRPGPLAGCLRCLAPEAQVGMPRDYEVIVSDDGRRSDTRRLVAEQFPWVRWFCGPRRGPSANRNRGASVARGAWLMFTDDDCLPDPHWLAAFAAATAQYPQAGAFEGAILPTTPFRRLSVRCPANDTGGLFWSANVAVRRDLFERVGGFCPLFPYAAAEDQDLYLRLQAMTPIPFIRAAHVRHPVVQLTVRQLLARIRPAAYSHTLLCLRHPHRLRVRGPRERIRADVLREARLIWRSTQIVDWRAIVAGAASLTWGMACGIWYSVTLRASVAPADRPLEPRRRMGPDAGGQSCQEQDRRP